MKESSSSRSVLCVDVDGTLVHTDLLYESLWALLRKNFLFVVLLPIWLCRGRSVLKNEIAQRVDLAVDTLPYNSSVVDFVMTAHGGGRAVVLASASDERLVQQVARHLDLPLEVIASTGKVNLKGEHKRVRLVERFGEKGFSYIGDSRADLAVWPSADEGYVVSRNKALIERAKALTSVAQVFDSKTPSVAVLFKAIRVHQWVKNLLLFVPLIMAHRVFVLHDLFAALRAFLAFSFCASSVYLLNDLVDLDSDRRHPTKNRRPFASGTLPLVSAFFILPVLIFGSGILCATLPLRFTEILIVYFLLTCAYSFRLKQIALIDIMLLALLYTVRILAGGFAVPVWVSPWLLAFSLFMFLSLACTKRYSELYRLRVSNGKRISGRGYVASDLELIAHYGTASGYIAALVLALYINSEAVVSFYSHAELLWLICILILFWISRVWLLAHRGELHEDPIVFAIRDPVSYVVGIISVIILLLAM